MTSGSVPALVFLRTIAVEISSDATGTEHKLSGGFGMKITDSKTWLRMCLIGAPHVGWQERGREKIKKGGVSSRWWRSKTWRSPSSPQIHQTYIYLWNNSYRTPTERCQKTSDLPKGKKLPPYLGRAKEKRKNRDKRIGTGPAPVGGSCEGGNVSIH